VALIQLNQYIINPQTITTITMEGKCCVVCFAGDKTPTLRLNEYETRQLLSGMRSLVVTP
jgi:hypothetical protein